MGVSEETMSERKYDFTKGAGALAHAIRQEVAPRPKPKPKPSKPPRLSKEEMREAKAQLEAKEKGEAVIPQEKSPKPPKLPRPVCGTFGHLTKAGHLCTARVLADGPNKFTTYCTDHRPSVEHLSHEEIWWLVRKLDWNGFSLAEPIPQGLVWLVDQIGWGRIKVLYQKEVAGAAQNQG